MADKAKLLEELKREMEADRALPLFGRASLVFGEGDPAAEVLFIGEAPGFHEDRLARPFVGQAGQLLNQLLQKISWPREKVYITNIIKRRPPENRDPLLEEIEAYKPYLQKQIDVIAPKIIAALGRYAMNYFLPLAKISRDHGRAVPLKPHLIIPLYHPAAALRSTSVLKELEEDFKKLPGLLADWPRLMDNAPGDTAEPEVARENIKQVSLF